MGLQDSLTDVFVNDMINGFKRKLVLFINDVSNNDLNNVNIQNA